MKKYSQFLFEDKKDLIPIIPNRFVYHTSNSYYRKKILKQGLIPKGKSETWLEDTPIEGKVIFAVNSTKPWNSTYNDDIYKIDTSKINNKWFKDPNFLWQKNSKEIFTFEPISLEAIELIQEGTGETSESMINESKREERIIRPYKDGYAWKMIDFGDEIRYILEKDGRHEVSISTEDNKIVQIYDKNSQKPSTEGLFDVYKYIADFLIDPDNIFFDATGIKIEMFKTRQKKLPYKSFTLMDLKPDDLGKLILKKPKFIMNDILENYDDVALWRLIENEKLNKSDVLKFITDHPESMNAFNVGKMLDEEYLSAEELKPFVTEEILKECSEYVIYQLYKKVIINKHQFIECFDDLGIFDGDICIKILSWNDIEQFMNFHERGTIIDVLDGSKTTPEPTDFDDSDYIECWKHLSKENKIYIIEKYKIIPFKGDNKEDYTLTGYYWDQTMKDFVIHYNSDDVVKRAGLGYPYYKDPDSTIYRVLDIFIDKERSYFDDVREKMNECFNECYVDSIDEKKRRSIYNGIYKLFGSHEWVKRGKYTRSDGTMDDMHYHIFDKPDLTIFENGNINYTNKDTEFYAGRHYSGYIGFFCQNVFENKELNPDYRNYPEISINEPVMGWTSDLSEINDHIEYYF